MPESDSRECKDSRVFIEYMEKTNKDCREICNGKINALDEKIDLHLRLNQRALDKESEVHKTKFHTMQQQVDILREAMAKIEGKADATSVHGAYALAILSLVIGLVDLTIRLVH